MWIAECLARRIVKVLRIIKRLSARTFKSPMKEMFRPDEDYLPILFGIKGAATAAFGEMVLDFCTCVPLLARVEGVNDGESTFSRFLILRSQNQSGSPNFQTLGKQTSLFEIARREL